MARSIDLIQVANIQSLTRDIHGTVNIVKLCKLLIGSLHNYRQHGTNIMFTHEKATVVVPEYRLKPARVLPY